MARECHDDGVALAVFPELTLSGYSIDDILMQETLLGAVQDALATIVAASGAAAGAGGGRAAAAPQPALQHRGGHPPRHRPGRRAQVVPADLPGVLRTPAGGAGDDVRDITVCGAEVPFGPDLLFGAADVPGLVLHVEICEDMWVPVRQAALAGATVLANLSGSPITVGRAEDRKLLARSASARCLAAYVYAAAGEGSRAPTWPGTARR
jgi:NAD+ synthase (glutamine-hydrolysing)